jgi:hypothetical protein
MSINIGDVGGAFAGVIAKDLRTQREDREAKQQKQLDEHSEAVNIAKKKLKPVFVKDLEIKTKNITDEFNSLNIPISKTTVYKIATDGYKEFETLKQNSPAKLQQFAGSASDDPSFDLQQAIELAAEEKATKDITPFMPPEEKSFLGFKVSSGERKIEREAKRLGMTAEEYKEFGSGAISAPQVDVALDKTVLSKVTAEERQEQDASNIAAMLQLPDSPRKEKALALARQRLASLPKQAGKVTESSVVTNLKFALAGAEKTFEAMGSMQFVPGKGRVFIGDISKEDAAKIGQAIQDRVRPLLNEYLESNNLQITGDIEKDIDSLPGNIKRPFLAAMGVFDQRTLSALVEGKGSQKSLIGIYDNKQKNFSINNKQGIKVRYSDN